MKYLIYLRVSTKEQDDRTQLDHCLRFIKQRDSSSFKYEVFTDTITSKKPIHKRDGGINLLNSIRNEDIVISMRLDRLCRSLSETTKLIDILEEKGADVLLVTQPGIKNKIMLGVYAGMAEEEVKLLRKRVSEKLQSKRRRNERYSGKLPYGYGLHETHKVPVREGAEIIYKLGVLVPIEHEQKVLAQMLELFDVGMSCHSIAKTLNDRGYKNREGRPFQKMSIYRILLRIGRTNSLDQPQGAREFARSLE